VSARTLNVLFLCTGNSARSIIAESTLNAMAGGRMRAFSAGSHPGGTVNPLVLDYLREKGIATAGARSKSWDEFAAADAPPLDFVITVCDNAKGEVCPIWPGRPVSAHWGVEDPAVHMQDPARAKQVIDAAYRTLRARIAALLELPLESMDAAALRTKLREIGEAG
jgi:arsenate reductase (thioredoxin)